MITVEGSNFMALVLIGATVLMGSLVIIALLINKKSSVRAEDEQKLKK